MTADDEAIYELLTHMVRLNLLVEIAIAHRAKKLAVSFKTERTHRQDNVMAAMDRTVGYQAKRNRTYAPLCLSARVHKKCLEITWFLTNHGRRSVNCPHMKPSTHHRSLPTSRARGPISYTTRTLEKEAQPWELDLVLATEAKAFELRTLNAHVSKLRKRLEMMTRALEATSGGNAPDESERELGSTFAQDDIYDNPDVAPQPPQHRRKIDGTHDGTTDRCST